MAFEAILTLVVPIVTALGSAAIAYFLMNARMATALSQEREAMAQERAAIQVQRSAMESQLRAVELQAKRSTLEAVFRLQNSRPAPETITVVPIQALPPLSIFQPPATQQMPQTRIAITKLLPPPAMSMKATAGC